MPELLKLPEAKPPFEVGGVVTLNGGGYEMTVVAIKRAAAPRTDWDVTTVWQPEGFAETEEGTFPSKALHDPREEARQNRAALRRKKVLKLSDARRKRQSRSAR